MNKKLTLALIALALIAIPLSIFALDPIIEEAQTEAINDLPIVPSVRTEQAIAPYYWYEEWDVCIIDGEEVRDVRFSWSDLGRSMIVDGEEIYREFEITECRRPAPEFKE